jgi:hypothetical protein
MYVIVAIKQGCSCDDAMQVIELPEGLDLSEDYNDADGVFVEWLKDVYPDEFEGLTDDEILETCRYQRTVCEVLTV